MARIVAYVAVALAFCLAFVAPSRAVGLLERLIVPGPVIEGHAKFEGDCSKCHEAFARGTQPLLCLNCHKEIAADRERKVGYHGGRLEALNRDCHACHADHLGRGADVVLLDRERFNHDQTVYRLVDAHAAVACERCHVAGRPFHQASLDCVGCHSTIDPHKGKLGDRCETCHAPTRWRELRAFDHDRTKFPLAGAHRAVTCSTCHAGEQFKDLPQACISCHRIQDVHGGRYGAKCESCHAPVGWKDVRFDHATTQFPLRGAHATVKCEQCHTGDLYAAKLATSCASCHARSDPHKGQLGDRCDQCHDEGDWRRNIAFDHNKTRFALLGAHFGALCENCHAAKTYRDAPVQCEKCHPDTHHAGRLGAQAQCGSCHDATSWKKSLFDHDRQTKYPLTGAHRRTPCEACHKSPNPPTLKLATACENCHKDDHQGRLGAQPKCESCHDTIAWSRWRFDHARQANYPLVGAHAALTCEKCHTISNPPSLRLGGACVDCHRRDNPHGQEFGPACERCHETSDWRRVTIRQ
jgi:hypothetical protein